MASAIAVAIIGAVFLVGNDVGKLYGSVLNAMPDGARACEQAHQNCRQS